MVNNWDNLSFTPTCDKSWYVRQLYAMNEYLDVLNLRAEKEKIDL